MALNASSCDRSLKGDPDFSLTWINKLVLSNDVTVTKGFDKCKQREISLWTLIVAVAVNAKIGVEGHNSFNWLSFKYDLRKSWPLDWLEQLQSDIIF